MLPTRLLAAASAGASGSAANARTRGQALRQLGPALRAQLQHGIDLLRAVALLAQVADQALAQEQRQLGLRLAVLRAEGLEGQQHQRFGVQRQLALDQHADHAQRMAAQRERVLVAGGQLADAEQADQRLQLVGQRHRHAGTSLRGSSSPAKRGL